MHTLMINRYLCLLPYPNCGGRLPGGAAWPTAHDTVHLLLLLLVLRYCRARAVVHVWRSITSLVLCGVPVLRR